MRSIKSEGDQLNLTKPRGGNVQTSALEDVPQSHEQSLVDPKTKDIEFKEKHQIDLPCPKPARLEKHGSHTGQASAGTQGDVEANHGEGVEAPLYSVFAKRQKHFIAFMVGWGGLFSSISANIYLPALNTLASHLGVSIELINLTITSYMILQGLSPTIMGDFSDMAGRRPAYVIAFVIYLGANIGLALQNNYAALLVLRCFQSAGSSGTIAIGAGVIADIVTSAERGSYMGAAFAGALVAPAIGPVFGGLLAQYLGWRAIFWFLVILASVYLTVFLIAFPETGRNVVGNASVTPHGWNMSLLSFLRQKTLAKTENREQRRPDNRETATKRRRHRFPNPLHTLRILLEKDVRLILTFNAIIFVAFYDITATLPTQLRRIYGYNELKIGLCFLPFGSGCALAAWLNGRVLDWNYARIARAMEFSVDHLRDSDASHAKIFPLEKARLGVCIPNACIGVCLLISYGWVLNARLSIAVPLCLLFVLGLTLTSTTNTMSTLLVDLFPRSPATATAANNFARCLMGAAGTAVVELMIRRLGLGWCFTLLALLITATLPLLFLVRKYGSRWREERRLRDMDHRS